LAGLLEALGAVSEGQAVERHREMVSRLRRLDQVRGVGAVGWREEGTDGM
jgi:hypothetical protein